MIEGAIASKHSQQRSEREDTHRNGYGARGQHEIASREERHCDQQQTAPGATERQVTKVLVVDSAISCHTIDVALSINDQHRGGNDRDDEGGEEHGRAPAVRIVEQQRELQDELPEGLELHL
jgi:hypothetical protein